MHFDFAEWLHLALRWLHLTAGIAWIGSSFYFVWLDNHLKAPQVGSASGELWSVHGGGFYHNQKYQVAPEAMPGELHWFKWEAYFTWISGVSLLILLYYVGAQNLLVDPAKAGLSTFDATALGVAAIAVGWGFYHLACLSPLGRDNRILGAVWFAFLVAAAAFLDSIFSSKGAYIHVGALIGTVMAANVFVVIIPNQKRVVAALVKGETPDAALGAQAKQRSLHNNYMTLPVLFIMISQHHPMTYGAERPWLVLALIALLGLAVRHIFNLRHRQVSSPLLFAVIGLLAAMSVGYVAFEKATRVSAAPASSPVIAAATPSYAAVAPIFARHCVSCHSSNPVDPNFNEPPVGMVLDSYEHARAAAAKVKQRAVDTQTMPMGNPTGMTASERQALGAWIAAGTPR